ncbi:hypothetical protein [Nocardiopsis aegyptia]|uniref:Secreted protein n=1 Tax=Nocardiopsis aegyptia TaxID=220378 RepID=A0A7Z0J9R8_9ACTN|nr:hypothetical protein [Nocardiopsis aegyptia]NYJ34518.1 hypothetical protein [Nocardiopsis aegyptia]
MRRIIATLALTAAACGALAAPAAAEKVVTIDDCFLGGGTPKGHDSLGMVCDGGEHDGAVVLLR